MLCCGRKGRAWSIATLDLRNHGRSARLTFAPPHTIDSAATDIIRLIEDEFDSRTPDIIMGHSLGGKIVLSFLQQIASGTTSLKLPSQVCPLF